MQGILVETIRRRHLDDLAQVHDDDSVRDVPDDREIMSDEQEGEIELVLQLLEQIHDLRLNRDVQCRHGLVADEELRIQGQGPCEPDSLALPTRELVGIAVGGIARKPDHAEQLLHALSDPASLRDIVGAQRLPHDAPDRMPRVQRRVRILEDHLHPSANGPELGVGHGRDVDPVEHDSSRRRLVEPQDRPTERRLATPGLPHEPERLAPLDRQRDTVDRLDVADVAIEQDPALERKPHADVVQLDEGPAARLRHADALSRVCCHLSALGGLKQAASCSASIGSSTGSSAMQRSMR